jgi:hypothetical protein
VDVSSGTIIRYYTSPVRVIRSSLAEEGLTHWRCAMLHGSSPSVQRRGSLPLPFPTPPLPEAHSGVGTPGESPGHSRPKPLPQPMSEGSPRGLFVWRPSPATLTWRPGCLAGGGGSAEGWQSQQSQLHCRDPELFPYLHRDLLSKNDNNLGVLRYTPRDGYKDERA